MAGGGGGGKRQESAPMTVTEGAPEEGWYTKFTGTQAPSVMATVTRREESESLHVLVYSKRRKKGLV